MFYSGYKVSKTFKAMPDKEKLITDLHPGCKFQYNITFLNTNLIIFFVTQFICYLVIQNTIEDLTFLHLLKKISKCIFLTIGHKKIIKSVLKPWFQALKLLKATLFDISISFKMATIQS